MHEARRTEVFDVPVEAFYETVIAYDEYPEFVPALREVEIFKQTKTKAHVAFTANSPLGAVHYTVNLKQKPNREVTWTLEESNVFRKMEGGWELLETEDGGVEVTYHVLAVPKVPAPGPLVRSLASRGLPKMLRSFRDRAAERE